MSNIVRFLTVFLIFVIGSSSNISAISRVAAGYNVMEFSVSSAQAHGSYNRIGLGIQGFVFDGGLGQSFEIDADDLYKNSTLFGLNYGRLINGNSVVSVGFSYIKANHQVAFEDGNFIYTYPDLFRLKLYNIDFNWNYYIMSPVKEFIAPYAGIGLQTGLLSVSVDGFASESDFIIATAFNFGADFSVWKSKNKMSSLAISSVNSYQFYASDSRPKYITFGVGLKYFMRP